jgi:uroporphyrinogen-III decarboxylase
MLFIDSETHAKNNCLPILQSVREITGKNVPVWNWWSAGAYLPLHVFGPEKYGGLGDVANKARHVAEATGRDVEEVTKEVLTSDINSVLETDKQLDDEHEAG